MSDTPPSPPGPSAPAGGGGFCGECGAALPAGATFCGECGAAAPGAAAGAPEQPDAPPAGASTWTGVQPVVERPTQAMPPVPPVPPAGGGAAPPPPGPPGAGAPPTEQKGKGPLVLVAVLVLAALGAAAFFLLGGDDDEVASDDTTTTTEEDDDQDETTTTTEADDEETTTTEDDGDDPLAGIEFVTLTDDTGRLTVDVPSDWTQVSTTPLEGGQPNIQASTDLEAFRTGFEVPGLTYTLLGAPAPENHDTVIDFLATNANLTNACTPLGKEDYADSVFTGRSETFDDCAGRGTTIVLIVASRADGQTIEVSAQLRAEDPIEIVEQMAASFNIIG